MSICSMLTEKLETLASLVLLCFGLVNIELEPQVARIIDPEEIDADHC